MAAHWLVTTTFVLGLAVAGAAAQTGRQRARGPTAGRRPVRAGARVRRRRHRGGRPGDRRFPHAPRPTRRPAAGRRAKAARSLILWDRGNKTRTEVELIVETREQAQSEAKLRALLRDFPSVKVERVGGDLVVFFEALLSAEDDLALIERMATSTGAESFVRYVAPEPPTGSVAAPAAPASPPRPRLANRLYRPERLGRRRLLPHLPLSTSSTTCRCSRPASVSVRVLMKPASNRAAGCSGEGPRAARPRGPDLHPGQEPGIQGDG